MRPVLWGNGLSVWLRTRGTAEVAEQKLDEEVDLKASEFELHEWKEMAPTVAIGLITRLKTVTWFK